MAGIIAGLQVILGGSALADFIDPKLIGLFTLILAAITVTYGVITRGQVTPWVDVVAKATSAGNVVAGPAANQMTGTSVTVHGPDGGVVAPPPDADRKNEG
jgi:hypothetical protein